jgi:hypothetical protein
MDVMSFLHLSLGSSTVQLHESLGSRYACAYLEAAFRKSKWRPWLRSILLKSRVLLCVFLGGGAKELCARDIHKEMFAGYVGKCLSRKAVHKFPKGRSKVADDARPGEEVARQRSKNFYSGFNALINWWNKCINVGGGYIEKHMFLSNLEFYISICDVFTDSPLYSSALHFPLSSKSHCFVSRDTWHICFWNIYTAVGSELVT